MYSLPGQGSIAGAYGYGGSGNPLILSYEGGGLREVGIDPSTVPMTCCTDCGVVIFEG